MYWCIVITWFSKCSQFHMFAKLQDYLNYSDKLQNSTSDSKKEQLSKRDSFILKHIVQVRGVRQHREANTMCTWRAEHKPLSDVWTCEEYNHNITSFDWLTLSNSVCSSSHALFYSVISLLFSLELFPSFHFISLLSALSSLCIHWTVVGVGCGFKYTL